MYVKQVFDMHVERLIWNQNENFSYLSQHSVLLDSCALLSLLIATYVYVSVQRYSVYMFMVYISEKIFPGWAIAVILLAFCCVIAIVALYILKKKMKCCFVPPPDIPHEREYNTVLSTNSREVS